MTWSSTMGRWQPLVRVGGALHPKRTVFGLGGQAVVDPAFYREGSSP